MFTVPIRTKNIAFFPIQILLSLISYDFTHSSEFLLVHMYIFVLNTMLIEELL